MLRTHTCGELRETHVGQLVTLSGWINRIRDMGKLIWVDLRDRYGLTQLFCEESEEESKKITSLLRTLSVEDVVQIQGTVVLRQEANPTLSTGKIEIRLQSLEVLSKTEQSPPFPIDDSQEVSELLRMKYRYLDLRRPGTQSHLILRHQVNQLIRTFLNQRQFLEIETPILVKSTPEGARDFLVPSRLHRGKCYALPQSPQLFKQLLMIGGMDRYYQIARCFRDEDYRQDRQPEFTQLDSEMSFVTKEDVMRIFESLIVHLFREIKGIDLTFQRIDYEQALESYGTDAPDLRYEMKLFRPTIPKDLSFVLFREKYVVGLCVKSQRNWLSQRRMKQLKALLTQAPFAAETLSHIHIEAEDSIQSPLSAHIDEKQLQLWAKQAEAQVGDTILFVHAAHTHQALRAAGHLRKHLAKALNLYSPESFSALWIENFPLFEQTSSGALTSVHHPFTKPVDLQNLKEPLALRAEAYDIVINGVEIGGGSIRISDAVVQRKIFSLLGLSSTQIHEQFGFFLEALKYGTPPHGGIAIGLDRFCTILQSEGQFIQNFIAFPKSASAKDLMMDAPSIIEQKER